MTDPTTPAPGDNPMMTIDGATHVVTFFGIDGLPFLSIGPDGFTDTDSTPIKIGEAGEMFATWMAQQAQSTPALDGLADIALMYGQPPGTAIIIPEVVGLAWRTKRKLDEAVAAVGATNELAAKAAIAARGNALAQVRAALAALAAVADADGTSLPCRSKNSPALSRPAMRWGIGLAEAAVAELQNGAPIPVQIDPADAALIRGHVFTEVLGLVSQHTPAANGSSQDTLKALYEELADLQATPA